MECLSSVLAMLTVSAFATGELDEAVLHGETDKARAIEYAPGETMRFTLSLQGAKTFGEGEYYLDWVRSGDDGKTDKGRTPLIYGKGFTYETSLSKPGFVRFFAQVFDKDGKAYLRANPVGKQQKTIAFDGGAAVQPEKLQGVPEPADFDAYWDALRRRLRAVPIRAEKKHLQDKGNVAVYAVSVDCAGPRPVTGYLTIPKSEGAGKRFPARLETHGYGYYPPHNPPSWVNENEIVFNINAHGMKLPAFGGDKPYYDKLGEDIKSNGKDYAFDIVQNSNRDTAYFNGMVLRVMRALQYLKTLPEWDGQNLIASGGSQGGLQTIWAAGCGEGVTKAESGITWCCDMGGTEFGRNRGGWFIRCTPALAYYDPVNVARRIPETCKTFITRAGLGDYTCPPSGLAILWNNMTCPKKIRWVQGSTHGYVPTEDHQEFTMEEGWEGQPGTVNLNGAWTLETFAQPDDGAVRALPLPKGITVKRYQATVPGCCEMELVKAGDMPDPMFSTNALAFLPLEGNQWLYTKTFHCPNREPGERVVLVFDGIDTLADVFLNGEKIGEAENMLIPHEFDITERVNVGDDNVVQVLLRPVGLAARDKIPSELGWTMGGGANHEFFRKAPHMYGWDIMPHMPFNGIWRDVRLEVRPKCHIDYPAWIVRGLAVGKRWADVHLRVRVTAPFSVYYKAKVRATLSRNGKSHSKEVAFRGPMCKLQIGMDNVDFWWPRGMGEPSLYDAKIELIADNGSVLAVDERKIGIRQFAFEYDDIKLPERPGKFLFRVNGEPLFVRGVDWVPLDPIPSRQAGHLSNVLPMMADLNCNLVRVWGGGVYEPEAFFDWCDANGVMVWQDFMMACAVPPMVDEFAEAMKKEVMSVVLRLRNHASLALWAGDNENDEAVVWALENLAPSPENFRITRKVIPDILREYDVTRPYLPSSPYRTDDCHHHRTRTAETHLWGGPRAWWKTDYYTNNPTWFSSEGGAHALPVRDTFDRMMPPEDVLKPWINPDEKDYRKLLWTPQWVYRATNPYLDMSNRQPWGLVHRNDHVLKQTGALFGDVPRHDVDLLIEQSQTAQAEAIKFLIELYRSQKFMKKSGFVVWNLRDGWPTISDAISDYYGNPKKSYHYLKRAFRTVLPIVTDFGRLVVVNDSLKPVKGHVKVTEVATGEVVMERDYEASANGVLDLAPIAWNGQGVFIIDYTADGETFRTHYLHGEPPFAWGDYVKWTKDL